MEKIKKIGRWIKNLPSQAYRLFRTVVMSGILRIKRYKAYRLNQSTGATLYIIAASWLDIRILNKQQYDFCKKWLKKHRGKDIREISMYRIDRAGVHSIKKDGFNLRKKG